MLLRVAGGLAGHYRDMLTGSCSGDGRRSFGGHGPVVMRPWWVKMKRGRGCRGGIIQECIYKDTNTARTGEVRMRYDRRSRSG